MIAKEVRFCDRDDMGALPDAEGKVLEEEKISYGTERSVSGHPRFLQKGCQDQRVRVVLLHNHPDGSSSASREDIAITDHLKRVSIIWALNFGSLYRSEGGLRKFHDAVHAYK